MVTITHEQNIICSETHLDGAMHEQTICKQLLFCRSHAGLSANEKWEKMYRMIKIYVGNCRQFSSTNLSSTLRENQEILSVTYLISSIFFSETEIFFYY